MKLRPFPLIYGTDSYFFTDKVKLTHGYIRSETIYPINESNRYTQDIAIQPERIEMELIFAGDGFETKYKNFYKNVALNSKPKLLSIPFLNLIVPECIIASTVQATASAKEYGMIKCNVVFIRVKPFEGFEDISFYITNTLSKINKFVDKIFNIYKYINLSIKTLKLALAYTNSILRLVKQPISVTKNILDEVETKKNIKKITQNNNEDIIKNISSDSNLNTQPSGDKSQDEFIESYQKIIQLSLLFNFSKIVLKKLYSKKELYEDLIILDYNYNQIKYNTTYDEINEIADDIYKYTYNYIIDSFSKLPLKEIELDKTDFYILASKIDINTKKLPDILNLNKSKSLYINNKKTIKFY